MEKIRLFIFILFVLAFNFSWSQVSLPHYEPFDYPVGDSLPMHGWIGVFNGDEILVHDTSLSYQGLATSIGHKISYDGSGRDFYQLFSSPPISGTVFMSYIMQVSNLGSLNGTGGYFTGLGSSTTLFGSTSWIKLNGGGYSLGLNARSTAANTFWDGTILNIKTPVFVVVSYEFVDGSTNDIANMWINPASSTFGASSAPTPTINIINGSTDLSQIDRMFLRQDQPSATPYIDMDEIRVGTTWAQVTPTSAYVKEIYDINKFQLGPNPSKGEMKIIFSPKTSYDIKIFNTLGSLIYSQDNINYSVFNIDLSKMNKGVYFIQLKDNNSSAIATKKFVVQ